MFSDLQVWLIQQQFVSRELIFNEKGVRLTGGATKNVFLVLRIANQEDKTNKRCLQIHYTRLIYHNLKQVIISMRHQGISIIFIFIQLIPIGDSINVIPQYQSGIHRYTDSPCTSCSNTYTLVFDPAFTVVPQVILSQYQIGYLGGLFGLKTEIIQNTITITQFQYTFTNPTTLLFTQYGLFWFAFVDDNIHTQFGSESIGPIISSLITYNRPQASVPSVMIFTNGIIFSTAPTYNNGWLVTIGASTTTDVSITITPSSGYVISYFSYSVIYANPLFLLIGQNNNCGAVSDSGCSNCCNLFTPIPNLEPQYSGIGFNSYDSQGTGTIRLALIHNGKYLNDSLKCNTNLGYATAWLWNTGNNLISYQLASFQYIPCPQYCTSCRNSYPNCDGCSPTSTRTGPDCLTCPTQQYANAGQIKCADCVNYCNNCQGSQSTCTACFGGRNNPPNCNTCTTANYYAQTGIVDCQQCASYCNGCVNASTQCTACSGTGRSVTPDCTTCPAQKFVLAGIDNCQQCNSNCTSCIQSAGQCLSCSLSSQTINIPNCTTCQTQMYFQTSSLSCQACIGYCNNCQLSSTGCSVCLTSTFRLNPPNCQTCPNNMFIKSGQLNCQQCDAICNQCTVASNNCTTCNGLYRTNAPNCNQCSQPNYYIDASQIDCQPCQSYCNGCASSSTNCIACWPFKLQTLTSSCPTCPTNEFALNPTLCTSNIASIVCTSIYNRDSICNCLPGFYNADNQLTCLKCSSICQTCTSTATNCLTCNSSILFSTPPLCGCQDGYFQLYGTCSQCSSSCAKCIQSSANCLTCTNPRQNPPQCSCPNGYFNNCTQQCSFQCQTCDAQASSCLVCSGNRINPPLCGCPDGSIQSQSICSNCSIAASTAQFSNDLNSIIITFEQPLNSISNCNAILNQTSLIALGTNPQCSIFQNVIILTLGTNATISQNQPILINSDILQFSKCNSLIRTIITPLIQAPQQFHKPELIFNNVSFTTTACDIVQINIIGQTYNGQRNLQLLGWTIVSADNSDNLNQLLNQWNSQSPQLSYIITSQYLQNQKNIQFRVSYQNFIGQQSSDLITIYIQSYSLQINLLVPQNTYVFDTTSISVSPSLKSCGANLLNQEIIVSVVISNQTTTLNYNYTIQSDEQQLITFEPFKLKLSGIYSVRASVKWNDLNTQVQQQLEVILYPIRVLIQGGDQQIGINQNLNLSAQIFDPNIQTSIDLSQYNITWQCLDMVTLQECLNFLYAGLNATLNTTGYQTYKTLQISIQAQKSQSMTANNNITISIIENKVIPIQLVGNQYQLNTPLNIYDQVDVTIQYQSAITFDVDDLTYYATYLDSVYELNVIQLNNIQTTINVQCFARYQLNSNVKFKVTVNNPAQSAASVATQNLFINIPPSNCRINIYPRGSKESIQIDFCISNSLPLQYQFIYYNSKLEFVQDSINGVISNGVQLNDFQTSPVFITYLSGQNDSIIVGRIKDAQNGLANTSISLSGIHSIDPTMFNFMLQDNSLNIPNNILFILIHIQTNNSTLSQQFINTLFQKVGNLNLSNQIAQQIQQKLSSQQTLSNNQIESQLLEVNSDINKISTQLSQLQSTQNLGEYDKNRQVSLLGLEAQLSASANHLSFLYDQSQQGQETVLGENITKFITQGVANITDILGNLTKINQEQKSINTSQFNLSAQKYSSQNINQQIGIQIINQSNQTVSYKNQYFKINPYQNKSDFANPVKAPLIVPNLTNANQVQLKPANPIPISFPLIGTVNISCASQIGDSWSLDVCTVVQSTTVQCLCQTLSPLSIVQALEFILGQFAQLFIYSITGRINSFLYQQALFTYIIIVFILTFFITKFILHRKDSEDNTKVHPQPEKDNIISVGDLDNNNVRTGAIRVRSIIDTPHESLFTPNSLVGEIQACKITKKQGFETFLKSSHVLFELYYRFDPEDPRILRLNILFLQIMGQICIFVLFGKNLAISIIIGLSIFQTAYGVMYQLILSKMIKSKNKYIHTVGVIIAICITGLCTYLIIAAMALYSSPYQSNIAALSYIASLFADYFVSNILVELGKFVFIIKTCNQAKFYKIFEIIIAPGLQVIIFGKALKKSPETSNGVK